MTISETLLRYWHTLKYLKPVQFYRRFWFRLTKPKVREFAAPKLRPQSRPWIEGARRKASMRGPTEFDFVGQTGTLSAQDWDDLQYSKLWRYNLHYFDDLNAQDCAQRQDWHTQLIQRWIDENPIGVGSGWEPYPVSLRIVNWIKFAQSGGRLTPHAQHSLRVQTDWLTQRLEYHLLGNHLFANAKALLFAGLYFDGADADDLRKRAVDILQKQIPEQILADGGQFELSPMYHAIALEDMLDITNILQNYEAVLSPPELRLRDHITTRIPAMINWLNTMSHPDGDIALFNDSAIGIAPDTLELLAYCARLDLIGSQAEGSMTHLKDSGYVRYCSDTATAIMDIGAIGPDYLPGHAHADSLSFELSLFGQRVFVNSGTSEYGLGDERLRQRGTAAHNTVIVAGENSSEVWSGFRVARRARIRQTDIQTDKASLTVEATHDGYMRLPIKTRHTRKWVFKGCNLNVRDTLSQKVPAQARYHVHPDVKLTQSSLTDGTLILPTGQTVLWRTDGAKCAIETSTWHPRFGVSLPNSCLVIEFETVHVTLSLNWS